jgi:hypothetical protein
LDYSGPTFSGEPKYLDNIQSARVTLANETSGKFSNTELDIVSGTWALKEDATTGIRYAECIVGGVLGRDLVDADTFTTQLFTQTGGVVLAKTGTGFTLTATAGDTITALQLTAP